jgi:putative flippase GtrA
MNQDDFKHQDFAADGHATWTARFPKFLAAGGVATLLHWGVMAVLVICGVQAWCATALAMAVGATANYFLQRRYVFFHAQGLSVGIYLLSVAMAWSVNLAAFQILHAVDVEIAPAQFLSTVLVSFLNFVFLQRVADRRPACFRAPSWNSYRE